MLRKAETFAAGITIVIGFQLLDIKTLLESAFTVGENFMLPVAGGFIPLIFAFGGTQLKGYADYPRGKKLGTT